MEGMRNELNYLVTQILSVSTQKKVYVPSLYLSLFAAVGVEAQLTVGLALAQRLAQQLHQPLLPDELRLAQRHA